MSQGIFNDIVPSTTNGIALASILNNFKSSVASTHSGTSRPTNIQAGGLWVDTTDAGDDILYLKMYDGTQDITLFTLNIGSGGGSVTPTPVAHSATIEDNKSTAGSITGFILDKESIVGAIAKYRIVRTDGTIERSEQGILILDYNEDAGWRISRQSSFDDALNMGDSIQIDNVTGQVEYLSDAMGGTHSGTFFWTLETVFAAE